MEVLKDQITTLLKNGLHDSAQMLGCFLVSSPTINVETNLHLKAESQALLGDTFFCEREYHRAIHNYKQALQYYKMIPKQNTPSSWSSLSSNRKPKTSVNRPPTPDVLENPPEREPTLQELLNIKLIESGEKERLMELLRERLVECGWKDDMKALCRAFVKNNGRNNVTVDELVHVITPKGRASIPDSVKAELLQRIRTFLMSAAV